MDCKGLKKNHYKLTRNKQNFFKDILITVCDKHVTKLNVFQFNKF